MATLAKTGANLRGGATGALLAIISGILSLAEVDFNLSILLAERASTCGNRDTDTPFVGILACGVFVIASRWGWKIAEAKNCGIRWARLGYLTAIAAWITGLGCGVLFKFFFRILLPY
jgi:hypothetical protein